MNLRNTIALTAMALALCLGLYVYCAAKTVCKANTAQSEVLSALD